MVKNYAKLEELDLKRIKPQGWLGDLLGKQISGLTGHMEAAGYPFASEGWGSFYVGKDPDDNEDPGWWAYEQTGYWLDGAERAAVLTGDRKLKKKAGDQIDYVLANRDPDGYLGPKKLKKSDGWNRWPHVVFFRALMAKYGATGDPAIIEAVRQHFLGHEQDYSKARDVNNIEMMIWCYLRCGDEKLLDLAKKTYDAYNAQCRDDNCVKAHASPKKAYAHGVTYNEFAKLGAILYSVTGDKKYLAPTLNAYKKIDRYQMLIDGVHCSNEFLLDNDYMQTHETCDVTDYMWAIGYVYMATGKGEWGDKIERATFNAGLGCIEENFKALQYFSCPNQVVLDRTSNHSDFFRADKWMSFRPNPGTECCAGNVNRFFPNYCSRMWMKKGRDIIAALYGASEVTYGGGASAVKITEDTKYPFSDDIAFNFSLKAPRKLRFKLRIPGWCKNPSLKVNGVSYPIVNKNGFTAIDRVFADGDKVELNLPSEAKIVPFKNEGYYVERGPLLYTLGMRGDRQIDEKERNQTKEFPAYNTYADKKWNYTILPDSELKFEVREGGANPFDIDETPYTIKVKGREVKAWKLTHRKKVYAVHNLYTRPWKLDEMKGDFTFTPRFPTAAAIKKEGLGKVEELTLVPYGAGKVRITIFPKIK